METEDVILETSVEENKKLRVDSNGNIRIKRI